MSSPLNSPWSATTAIRLRRLHDVTKIYFKQCLIPGYARQGILLRRVIEIRLSGRIRSLAVGTEFVTV